MLDGQLWVCKRFIIHKTLQNPVKEIHVVTKSGYIIAIILAKELTGHQVAEVVFLLPWFRDKNSSCEHSMRYTQVHCASCRCRNSLVGLL